MSNRIAPKLLAEFIGTLSFVFIGAGAAAVVGGGAGLNGITAVAFAHGLAIMAFAFAYGPVSGAHMNPAVTVGVLAAGAMGVGEAIGYIISQLIGGIAGALLLRTVLDVNPARALGPMVATGNFSDAWLYMTAPVVGAIVAALLHKGFLRLIQERIVAAKRGRAAQTPAE
jgi:glycerol uptake facilitator-like aquaporin